MTLSPPQWTLEQIEQGVERAIQIFREERLSEAREDYASHFREAQAAIEDLLELTVDLTELDAVGREALIRYPEALRYCAAPPISEDDLATVSGVEKRYFTTATRASTVVQTLQALIDTQKFPWVVDGREPQEDERRAAVTATAAAIAARRIMTARANKAKAAQEALVSEALRNAGFVKVPPRQIRSPRLAPGPGEFCGESLLGTRKADLVVGLQDNRLLAVECKVSNSALNSVKRINNDAAVKARVWTQEFGTQLIVPAAVIAGVFKPSNLMAAQDNGLTIWWSHDLHEMIQWVTAAK